MDINTSPTQHTRDAQNMCVDQRQVRYSPVKTAVDPLDSGAFFESKVENRCNGVLIVPFDPLTQSTGYTGAGVVSTSFVGLIH